MSTFFQKLTGARPAPVKEDDYREEAAQEEKPRNPSKKAPQTSYAERQKTATHLRVEQGEREEPPAPEARPEEGELTVDIYDQDGSIVIQSTVAGVKPEDLDVSITSDSVTIRGKRERQEEISEKDFYYKELFWGTFSRSVILPEEIDDTGAEATLKHGLLIIKLPKKRRGTVQKLKVRVT